MHPREKAAIAATLSDAGLLYGFDGDLEETAEGKGWIALVSNVEGNRRPATTDFQEGDKA